MSVWTPEQLSRAATYGTCTRCSHPRYARLERRNDELRMTLLCENGHYADYPWTNPDTDWHPDENA